MKKLKFILFSIFTSSLLFCQSQRVFSAENIEIKSAINIPSVAELITTFISWLINIGVVAITLAFIYVGFQFVASRGNPKGIESARQAFLWTVVGTLVLLGGKVLVEVIKQTLTSGGIISS